MHTRAHLSCIVRNMNTCFDFARSAGKHGVPAYKDFFFRYQLL